jgi:hypothetical protein
MITEDKLAAATMAQIFGSELLRVDQTTMSGEGQSIPATRIDPKKILLEGTTNNQIGMSQKEQKMIEMLQREAELSHPIPHEQLSQAAMPIQQPIMQSQHLGLPIDGEVKEQLKSISESLKRIADHICNNDQQSITIRKRNIFAK